MIKLADKEGKGQVTFKNFEDFIKSGYKEEINKEENSYNDEDDR